MRKVSQVIFILGSFLILIGLIVNFVQKPNRDIAVVLFKDETGKIIYEKTVKIGELVEAIQPTEKEGHVFVGWFYESVAYDFSSKVLKDLTLIGKWEETLEKKDQFIVTFYNDDYTLYESQTIKPNEKLKVPSVPVSESGNEFIGWYHENELFDFNTQITSNMTLYARYKGRIS